MSVLKANQVEAASVNTSIVITGNGTGGVNLAGVTTSTGTAFMSGKLTSTSTDGIEIDVASGDPKIVFDTQGADKFTLGVDDSDGDKFKIDTGATVGGATAIEVDGTVAAVPTVWTPYPVLKINAQSGTTYTLVLTDSNKLVTFSSGSATTVTIPPNSSVAYSIGTVIAMTQLGSGLVTLAAGSGVTIRQRNGLNAGGQYAMWSVIKIDSDTWSLAGDNA